MATTRLFWLSDRGWAALDPHLLGGRPVSLAVMPGNLGDIKMALPLLARVALPKWLTAGKAYDADSLRGIATRYDRLAANYLFAIPLVAAVAEWA